MTNKINSTPQAVWLNGVKLSGVQSVGMACLPGQKPVVTIALIGELVLGAPEAPAGCVEFVAQEEEPEIAEGFCSYDEMLVAYENSRNVYYRRVGQSSDDWIGAHRAAYPLPKRADEQWHSGDWEFTLNPRNVD